MSVFIARVRGGLREEGELRKEEGGLRRGRVEERRRRVDIRIGRKRGKKRSRKCVKRRGRRLSGD